MYIVITVSLITVQLFAYVMHQNIIYTNYIRKQWWTNHMRHQIQSNDIETMKLNNISSSTAGFLFVSDPLCHLLTSSQRYGP